jgi:hypothetical protein
MVLGICLCARVSVLFSESNVGTFITVDDALVLLHHWQATELVDVMRVLEDFNIRCRDDVTNSALVCMRVFAGDIHACAHRGMQACVHI